MDETKDEFFDKLHEKLGKKYKIHPYAVQIIRSMSLNQKLVGEAIVEQMQKLLSRRVARVGIYRDVIKLVGAFTPKEWQDLIQKTKFDK